PPTLQENPIRLEHVAEDEHPDPLPMTVPNALLASIDQRAAPPRHVGIPPRRLGLVDAAAEGPRAPVLPTSSAMPTIPGQPVATGRGQRQHACLAIPDPKVRGDALCLVAQVDRRV